MNTTTTSLVRPSSVLTREFLLEHYEKLGKSADLIAKEVGCSSFPVLSALKKHGLKRRKSGGHHLKFPLLGLVFGTLTVIEEAGCDRGGNARWRCRCVCGKETVVLGRHLRTGCTTSCGCFARRLTSERKWAGHGEISGYYWNSVKRNAEQRSLDLAITIEQAWNLFLQQGRQCALSGIALSFARCLRYHHDTQTASLDRKDSSLGYTVSNSQWVHKDVNFLKGAFPESRFVELCQLVSRHQEEKQSR